MSNLQTFFLNIVEKEFAKMVLEFYLAFEHDELDLAQLDAKLRQFCVKTLKTHKNNLIKNLVKSWWPKESWIYED